MGRMKAQNYWIRDRKLKDCRKKAWLTNCRKTRENITILKLNLIGGIINKFYSAWQLEKVNLALQGPGTASDLSGEEFLARKKP